MPPIAGIKRNIEEISDAQEGFTLRGQMGPRDFFSGRDDRGCANKQDAVHLKEAKASSLIGFDQRAVLCATLGALGDIPLLTKPYRKEDLAQILRDVLDDRKG
jgi:hypothetical protein